MENTACTYISFTYNTRLECDAVFGHDSPAWRSIPLSCFNRSLNAEDFHEQCFHNTTGSKRKRTD